MSGIKLRLTLFLGLIIGPASVLTFLSLRAALDEQRSALADVRLQAPALRAVLDDRLEAIVAELAADSTPVDADALPEIMFHFALDSQGTFVQPAVLLPALFDRSPLFAAALQRGEALEFTQGSALGAAQAYDEAFAAAESPNEQAEALNALGRARWVAGDTLGAADAHRRLEEYARFLDADGAHPLTLSTMRRVASFASDSTDTRTAELIARWVRAVLADEIPLHSGTGLAVNRFASSLRRRQRQSDRPALHADLDRVTQRADFVTAYDQLLETALVRPEATYFCARGPMGGTLFAVARPTDDGGAVGARIDLQGLSEVILSGDAGQNLQNAGFEVVLFGVDDTNEFERRYGEAVRLVTTASSTTHRLNLGVVSRDQPFVFEHYRNRSALLVGGIALLAGAIALGVWVVLRETTREVQTAQLRSEFVANVSHELRTPLTAIRMYAETLLSDRVTSDEQRRDYLRTMMRESQRLSRMVGNILDFSRLESGRKSFEFAELDVSQPVLDTLEEFEPVFEEQGFDVDIDIQPDLPMIRADSEALSTAVANLVGNAVKYAAEDRQISVRVLADARYVCIEVADRGIGVPADERRTIFDKYRRASNAAGRATGTGLGLALVAGIVESHHGKIEVRPRAGGGTVFCLRLPLMRSV